MKKILDNFKDKNVLLVCTETYSWPMHYVAQELKNTCSNIHCLFIQPGEAYFKSPEYTAFRALNNHAIIHSMEEVVDEYLAKFSEPEKYIDEEYIDRIESLYTTHASLNTQFHSEMTLISYMHDRTYYRPLAQKHITLYAQIYYKWMEKLFEAANFDMILDSDTASFGRSVLLEISTIKKIPNINLDDGRIKNYNIPTNNLYKSVSKTIRQTFEDAKKNLNIEDELRLKRLVNEIRSEKRKAPKRYSHLIAKKRFSLIRLSKGLINAHITFFKYLTLKRVWFNFVRKVSSPICGNIFLIFIDIYKYYFRNLYIRYSGIFERPDLNSLSYIFVPLHVIPEASTIVLAPHHINELYIIESLAKSIAVGQYIVVKEHWGMLGERPIQFYKRLKRIPNVILVDPELYESSVEYIENCDLVATISGTTALEAAFNNKNSIIFSDVLFGLLSAVKRVTIDEGLSQEISTHMKHRMQDQELLAYLAMLVKWGESVDLNALMVWPSKEVVPELKLNIYKLLSIYAKGLELFNSDSQNNYQVNQIGIH